MEFRILGSLEVVGDDERPISIHRGKEQALLAYFLLHPNHVVSSDRLIDELWSRQPPATAPKILQNAVSQLRKALGEGRLVTQSPGYLFKLEADELDANRFERLVAEARRTGDEHLLRQALALWQGEPLANLADEPFARRAAHHLEEARLSALEDRFDADLAAGRHSELVPELEHIVASQPLRERPYGQLMVALYGSGRQADALETYQRARRVLDSELGLEPGPALQELERKILNHDPELGLPQRRPAQRPPLQPPRLTRRMTGVAVGAILLVAAAAVGLVTAFGDESKPIVVQRNSVVAVDPADNRVVGATRVGAAPRGVVVVGDSLWVANSADGTLSRVDIRTLELRQTVGIGAQATELAATGGAVWVATGIDNTLVKVDARSGGVVATVRLPGKFDASAHAVTAARGAIWAVSGAHGLKVDPQTAEILVDRCCAGGLRDIAYGEGSFWLANVTENVLRISPQTLRPSGTINLGTIITALAAGYHSVWAAGSDPYRPFGLGIWRVDPQTLRIAQTINLGQADSFLATVDVALGAGSLWATNYDRGDLLRIDPTTGTVTQRIHIGHHPRGIVVGAGRVWVTVD